MYFEKYLSAGTIICINSLFKSRVNHFSTFVMAETPFLVDNSPENGKLLSRGFSSLINIIDGLYYTKSKSRIQNTGNFFFFLFQSSWNINIFVESPILSFLAKQNEII